MALKRKIAERNRIRQSETVRVITGKDKGRTGKVRSAHPKNGRLLIEGINFIKKHVRAMRQVRQAGIIEQEASINVSNVMLLCSKCNHPARVGFHFLEDGKKVRVCQVCHEVID